MLIGRVKCELCGRSFKAIAHTHLTKEHGMTLREYMDLFPNAPLFEKCISNSKVTGKDLLLDALRKNWSNN